MMLFPDNWFSKICPLIDDRGFTIVGSISQIGRIPKDQDPDKLILYNWDVYPWMDYTRGLWKEWGDLLRACRDVWHCSWCTQLRTREIYGVDKGRVIKTFVPVDHLDGPVVAGQYALMPMRHYVNDQCFDWAAEACEQMRIPLMHPNHSIAEKEYPKVLRNCRFIISHYAEASTGGLGIIEGTYFGKHVVLNESVYNGGSEYLRGRLVSTFNSFNHFKDMIKYAWDNHESAAGVGGREWVLENYSIERMAGEINQALSEL